MPSQAIVTIDGDDWVTLYKRIRHLDNAVGKRLRTELTKAARPARDAVRKAALAIPSKGGTTEKYRKKKGVDHGGAGLRQGIAYATEIKVGVSKPDYFSLRIRVSGSKFRTATGKPATLPRYMEGMSRKPWRHPVFVAEADMPGPDGSWAAQEPHPYLLETVMQHKPAAIAAVRKAFIEALGDIGFTAH